MHAKPKKRLGQNFLLDKNLQDKIVVNCGFEADDIVLEIGSGRGELTSLIAPKVSKVYALEIDRDLFENLEDSLNAYENVQVIKGDILKFGLKDFLKSFKSSIKVFGNIPYYITTPIIELLLENKEKIDTAYLTVQKEFARRICSSPGSKEYGSLSCFVQYYAQSKIKFCISRNCFHPLPKVDSCLLELKMRQSPAVEVKDEKLFFEIIRKAFNQRRKTLKNSLKEIVPPERLSTFFKNRSLNEKIRPERLALADFAALANISHFPT